MAGPDSNDGIAKCHVRAPLSVSKAKSPGCPERSSPERQRSLPVIWIKRKDFETVRRLAHESASHNDRAALDSHMER